MTGPDGIKVAVEVILSLLGVCSMIIFKQISENIKALTGDVKRMTGEIQKLSLILERVSTKQEDHDRRIVRLEIGQ